MGTLILVRHGQASWNSDDYDHLSDVGVTQAKTLGEYWGALPRHIDVLYTGPLRRQRHTADHLRAAADAGGVTYPEARVHEGLSEYPAFEILDYVLPGLLETDPVVQAGYDDEGKPNADGSYIHALQHIMTRWAKDELDVGPHERYPAFQSRVVNAVRDIVNEVGHGKTVVATTSGGPVGIAVQHALGLTPENTIQMAWTVANGSITEFKYADDHLGLQRFNAVPHLEPKNLVTFR